MPPWLSDWLDTAKKYWNVGVEKSLDRWRALRRHPWVNCLIVFGSLVVACGFAVWLSSGKLSDSPSWAIYLTLSAAVLGLFRDAIVRWIWFPELELIFNNAAPYCDAPPMTGHDQHGNVIQFPSIWFRPLVVNRGTARAEKVEVMVTDVHIPQPNGQPSQFDRQYSMNLGWSNSKDAVREGAKKTVWDGLNPGMQRFFDLGKIYEPAGREMWLQGTNEILPNHQGRTLFSIETEVPNNNRDHLLDEGDWQVTLLLSAANHETLYYRANIHLSGVWVPGGMDAMLEPQTGGVRVTVEPIERHWW